MNARHLISLWLLGWAVAQAGPRYPLSDAQHQRYQQLLQGYRCLVCQNQSLADSNAPLAQDLKDVIYEKIKAGASDDSIDRYLTDRYGQAIRYKPKLNEQTMLLWLTPGLLLAGAWLRRHNTTNERLSKEHKRPCPKNSYPREHGG